MAKLILASISPRRRDLLALITKEYEICPSLFEERGEGLSAYQTALCFAKGKAREVLSRKRDCVVIGADTVVSVDGEILGKPKNEEDAKRMLRLLSGRAHEVFTGVCVCASDFEVSDCVSTKVYFHALSEEVIEGYVASGKPMDKAGAYGIQDGFELVRKIEGSYSNVMGLPMERLQELFKQLSLPLREGL